MSVCDYEKISTLTSHSSLPFKQMFLLVRAATLDRPEVHCARHILNYGGY